MERKSADASARQPRRSTRLLLGLVAFLMVSGVTGGVLLIRGGYHAPPLARGMQWCPITELGTYAKIDAFTALSSDNAWLVGETSQDPASASFAHWDGHHWQAVANDSGTTPVSLYALDALSANDIWAVGARTIEQAGGSGTTQVAHIEHWDGSRWQVVESPRLDLVSPGTDWSSFSGVSSTAPNDVWASGAFSTPSPQPQGTSLLEHWDGHAWNLVPLPEALRQSSLISLAALAPHDLWVLAQRPATQGNAGETVPVHWNGTHWIWETLSSVGTGIFLSALAGHTADDLWGAGTFHDETRNVNLPLLAHWDGKQWARAFVPAPDRDDGWLEALQIVNRKDLWAAGTTGTNGIFLEHWDGAHWHLLSAPAAEAAHPINVDVFGATAGKVWVVEQSFVTEDSSDPHVETTCPV